MPAVREVSPSDEPVKLEIVEVEPGVFLKLNPADKKAILDRQAAAASDRAAWEAGNRGDAAAAASPAAGVAPLTVLSKAELVDLAEVRGLKTTGSKADIAARIGAGSDEAPGDGDDAVDEGAASGDEG